MMPRAVYAIDALPRAVEAEAVLEALGIIRLRVGGVALVNEHLDVDKSISKSRCSNGVRHVESAVLRNFRLLALECLNADFRNQIIIFQHSSRSTVGPIGRKKVQALLFSRKKGNI